MDPGSLLAGTPDGAWLLAGIAAALTLLFGIVTILALIAMAQARAALSQAEAGRAVAEAQRDALEASLLRTDARLQAAEAALARSTDQQAQLAALAPIALITLDASGIVIRWNAMATELFGWHAAEITGQPLPLVIPGLGLLQDALLRDGDGSALMAGSDLEIQGRDAARSVRLAVAVMRTGSQVDQVVLMARDRTAEIDAENERREVNAAFTALLRRLRDRDREDREAGREPVRLRPVS